MLTLIISILALAGTAVSITWQIVSWQLTGPRLKVSATWGVGPRQSMPTAPALYLSVEAANAGRAETTVQTVGFLTPSGEQIVNLDCALQGRILPQKLAPGESLSFYYEITQIQQALREAGVRGTLRPFAKSGHGRRVGRGKYSAEKVLEITQLGTQ